MNMLPKPKMEDAAEEAAAPVCSPPWLLDCCRLTILLLLQSWQRPLVTGVSLRLSRLSVMLNSLL